MPSKAPLGDGEEEEEEEFREISFGYTGGVFYPFERAPFREEEEEEESIFPRAKRPLLSSVSSSRDEGGGFKRIETDGRPIVASVARCPESEPGHRASESEKVDSNAKRKRRERDDEQS